MEDIRKRNRVEIVIEYELYVKELAKFVFSGMEWYESESVGLFFAFKHNEK